MSTDYDMPIVFQSLSMMDLRSRPGQVLDDVAQNGRSFVIERNGQQKAFLVPLSLFVPEIQANRITMEHDNLVDAGEKFRISITASREMQFIFPNLVDDVNTEITITLPHGYPNKSPVVRAESIEESCPHRWEDGSICIYGAMAAWNPGKHTTLHVLELCRRWLANYASWQKTGTWPTIRGS